jgi:hypothetical protein
MGAWGDGSDTSSVLDMASSLTTVAGGSPVNIVLVPQANVICKVSFCPTYLYFIIYTYSVIRTNEEFAMNMMMIFFAVLLLPLTLLLAPSRSEAKGDQFNIMVK